MHHFSLFVCGLNAYPPYGWAKQLAPYNSMGFMPLGPLSSTPHSYRIWNVSISWNTSGVSHKSDSVAGLAGIQNTAGMAVSMCVTLQRSAREVSAYACWGTTQIFGSYQNSCQLLICQPYTRIEQVFATAVWMSTGVLQNQNKLARVAQGYGKRREFVTNFIETLNNLYFLTNNVQKGNYLEKSSKILTFKELWAFYKSKYLL